MTPPLKSHRLHGRVVDLPSKTFPNRLCVMVAHQMEALEVSPEMAGGLALGDWVACEINAREEVVHLEKTGGAGKNWDATGDGLRWRPPGVDATPMGWAMFRGQVVKGIRSYFDEQGFLEVETPVLVKAPSPEPQFVPVSAGEEGYLITSPEFQMKRLLVGGFEKIFRMGPVFRAGEVGHLHNPEFTMLEWYRAWTTVEAMMADLESLLTHLAPLTKGAPQWGIPGNQGLSEFLQQNAPPPKKIPQKTIAQLFEQHLGCNLTGVSTVAGLKNAWAEAKKKPSAEILKIAGSDPPKSLPEDLGDEFERAFFSLWDLIEPALGPDPLLVTHWPAPLASLARLHPGDPSLAERVELYIDQVELANGFTELTDPVEQRARFEADLANRTKNGLPPLPLDEAFLKALEQGMPPASGMALGVDRLVMVLGGASHIHQVIPFPNPIL